MSLSQAQIKTLIKKYIDENIETYIKTCLEESDTILKKIDESVDEYLNDREDEYVKKQDLDDRLNQIQKKVESGPCTSSRSTTRKSTSEDKEDKYEYGDNIIVVNNYGKANAAIFGNLETIGNMLVNSSKDKNKKIRKNKRLAYGSGWNFPKIENFDVTILKDITDIKDIEERCNSDEYEILCNSSFGEVLCTIIENGIQYLIFDTKEDIDAYYTNGKSKTTKLLSSLPKRSKPRTSLKNKAKTNSTIKDDDITEDIIEDNGIIEDNDITKDNDIIEDTLKDEDSNNVGGEKLENEDVSDTNNNTKKSTKAISLNSHENYEDNRYNLIVYKIQNKHYYVGSQNKRVRSKGLKSVNYLTKKEIDNLKKDKKPYLTKQLLEKVKNEDEDLYKNLSEIRNIEEIM